MKTYAILLAAAGILAKSVTVTVPQESGLVGDIELAAENLAVGDKLTATAVLTVTDAGGKLNYAVSAQLGPLHEAFDATEQLSGIEGLIVDGTVGTGKSETLTAEIVEVS